MMGYAVRELEVVNQLELINCCACGTPFGVEAQLNKNLKENHNLFYCPLGHSQSYRGKSEADRLREQLLARETSLQTERQLRAATEAKLARMKKRVGNGTCPCCNRSFSNLHRHMNTKHPNFKKPDAVKIG